MMLRIYKRYDLPLPLSDSDPTVVPGRTVTFSSYPGSLFSGDDFYEVSSGLVVVETTLGNNNQSLFNQFITPQSVLEFYRNVVANRLATDGGL